MQKKELFKAITYTEKLFKHHLASKLNLIQIKGPLFLDSATGLNDDLSGTEKPLSFKYQERELEIVQSLAKWKRHALKLYDFDLDEGLFVEMHAIRPDENELGKYHDLHVDQYDWEKHIDKPNYTLAFLKKEVTKIYQALYQTKSDLQKIYPHLACHLKKELTFITSEKLLKMFPTLDPEAREKAITQKYGSVFIIGIGHHLSNGKPHGLRAPDYDNWNLNGDLLVWDQVNQDVLEISSMGIRVDDQSILKQHQLLAKEEKLTLPYHQKILTNKLPLSIGGGIGRSRVNMFLLEQSHIQDVK